MISLYQHEMKNSIKSLLFWSFIVGGMGLLCILLFSGMQDEMKNMSDNFSNMGKFSDAMGLNKLNIGTLAGYFATEIGVIHGLGGGMFAASIGTVILSKEEDSHTGEFLLALPISRKKIVSAKLFCMVSNILLFTITCGLMYSVGFAFVDESILWKEFFYFLCMQALMNVEIAIICFAVSAWNRKNRLGIGFGIAVILYFFDLMARVIPNLKKYIGVGPFSYANAADIFSKEAIYMKGIFIGVLISLIFIGISYLVYMKRDMSS